MKTYRSNGKLLLTGEYAVLDGALALAVPTKLGQSLSIESNSTSEIKWKSLDENGNVWFEDNFEIQSILSNNKQFESNEISGRLVQILRAVLIQNSKFIKLNQGLTITTSLEFNKSWGLGTSSTLINNIASWARIDAYKLLEDTFGGSGYDVACAQNNSPILYQLTQHKKPQVTPVSFNPPFKENLYFVYLNKKQDSREGISSYNKLNKANTEAIKSLSTITREIVQSKNLENFSALLLAHERIISDLIQQDPIKNRLFKEFDGVIKSLGAWGGDFVLVASKDNPEYYFKSKGYHTIISYSDMVLG